MDPFLRPDSLDIRDLLADGTVSVVEESGILGLTVSALARWLDVTPPALTNRLRGPDGSRRRIIRLVTITVGQRWLDWSAAADGRVPLPLALPETAAECRGVRVWSALHELARAELAVGNPDPAGVIDRFRAEERSMVTTRLRRRASGALPTPSPGMVCAVAAGLRQELAAESPAITLSEATVALEATLQIH